MPNANEGTILITGANGGLGSAIAEQIATDTKLSSFHGIYTVRDASAAPALKAALARASSSYPHNILSLDLTDLVGTRQVAEEINVSLVVPRGSCHGCYMNNFLMELDHRLESPLASFRPSVLLSLLPAFRILESSHGPRTALIPRLRQIISVTGFSRSYC